MMRLIIWKLYYFNYMHEIFSQKFTHPQAKNNMQNEK